MTAPYKVEALLINSDTPKLANQLVCKGDRDTEISADRPVPSNCVVVQWENALMRDLEGLTDGPEGATSAAMRLYDAKI